MSGEHQFGAKLISPVKCNEKPWDLWASEIGHSSPRRDDDVAFAVPRETNGGASARRLLDHHPYKGGGRTKYRRAGLHRLPQDSMSLHGIFPQMDNLNAAVCHMCGVIVKCSAAYRHLLDSHTSIEPLFPPPPPVSTVRNRSRHKKEPQPPVSLEVLPVKMETSPVHTATAPLSRIVLPQPDLQYLEEASTSSAVTAEVQVCMESGELPVVSIQDTDDLPLGENLTDDIFAIMNSEGIQSADDITNSADWKNIIRDIGNMQELNFPQATDTLPSSDVYAPLHNATLPAYTLTEADLSSIAFPPNLSPLVTSVIDQSAHTPAPVVKTPTTPSTSTRTPARSKTGKTKFNQREYDPNKHCGVIIAETSKPCTRSLTCKAHALSLRRTVEGRAKPFDTLLAEHRASRDAGAAAAALAAAAAATPSTPLHATAHPAAVAPLNLPPLLVNSSTLDLSAFNTLTAEQQVNDIYASLLSVEDGDSMLPDTASITSLLSQPLPADAFLLPDDAELPEDIPLLSVPSPVRPDPPPDESPPALVPTDVCWYAACPRPLAICTFNASHAGGAITLGKKFATVRSNIKSSLTRSQCKSSGASSAANSNDYYYNQNALPLSKSVHWNTSKSTKPEVRKLIVTCSRVNAGGGSGGCGGDGSGKEVRHTLSELFGAGEVRHTLNGHALAGERKRASLKQGKRPAPAVLDLGFSLETSLLADEKC